jgi:hypothetical protein
MRLRRALFVVLSLCLLLAQDAALAHGISHIVVPDRSTIAVTPSLEKLTADHADEFCVECLAFAQVMGAACDTVAAATAVVPPASKPCAAIDRRADAAPLLAFRARAPPLLLA